MSPTLLRLKGPLSLLWTVWRAALHWLLKIPSEELNAQQMRPKLAWLFFIMKCHKMLCVHCAYIIWILAQKQKERKQEKGKRKEPRRSSLCSRELDLSEIRCVRYRCTAVKMSQPKDSSQTLPINGSLGYRPFFNLEIQNKEVKLIQVFFSLLFKFSSTWILVRFVVLLFFKVEMTWMEVLWEKRRGALLETDMGA